MKRCVFVCVLGSAVSLGAATVWVDRTSTAPAAPYATEGTAAATIDAAMTEALSQVAGGASPVIVRVKDGTYDLADEIRVTGGIRLESVNGPEKTCLNQTTLNRRVLCVTKGTVNGFTVTSEAGVTTANVDSPTGSSYGYGVYISGASACVENCIIEGIVSTKRQSKNPQYYGGTVYVEDKGTLRTSIVRKNSAAAPGGGVFMNQNSVVSCCVITNNRTTSYGGGVRLYKSGSLQNCLVAGNTASTGGGGVYANGVYTGTFSIRSCTIADNVTETGVGGLRVNGQIEMTVRDCLVLHNRSSVSDESNLSVVPKSDDDNQDSITLKNCLSTQFTATDRVIYTDCRIIETAAFADRAAGDYRLTRASPALDAASSDVAALATDLTGRARPKKGVSPHAAARADVGCYEFDLETDALLASFDRLLDERAAAGEELAFAASFIAYGEPVSGARYVWNFGDGSDPVTMSEAAVTHRYAQPGIFTVSVRAETETLSDTAVARDAVFVYPAEGFTGCVRVRPGAGTGVYPFSEEASAMGDLALAVRYVRGAVARGLPPAPVRLAAGAYDIAEELVLEGGMSLVGEEGPLRTTVTQTTLNRRVAAVTHGTLAGVTVHGAGCQTEEIDTALEPGFGFAVLLKGTASSRQAVLTNCVIEGFVSSKDYPKNPSLHGGTLALVGGYSVARASTVRDNRSAAAGAGVFLFDDTGKGGSLLRDCRILGNAATTYHGGGVAFHGGARLYNCLIAGNTAPTAAGVWGNVWTGDTEIWNCTIVGNDASGAAATAGMTLTYQLNFSVDNCVVSGNRAAGTSGADFSCQLNDATKVRTLTLNNCRLPTYPDAPNVRVVNCRTGETAFDEGTYLPLRPADVFNGGRFAAWMTEASSLDGGARIRSRVVDIGCFESDWEPGLLLILK